MRATLLTMNKRRRVRVIFAAIVLTVTASAPAFAQGTLVRPTPESETRDSSGNLKIGNSAEKMVRGSVVLADGDVPEELVAIYSDCGGIQTWVAAADSKGRFSFDPVSLGVPTKAKECRLRAFLEGYHSDTRAVTDMNSSSGKLVLQPLSPDASGLTSNSGQQASKAQRKMYDKALDEAARREWPNAIASLQKAVSAYPGYSSAWLSLGILQQTRDDRAGAEKSFLESVRADPKFALPLIEVATLEAARGDWRAVLDHSEKAIALNPAAFPDAYALNASANVSLQNVNAAEKSAQEGIKLDREHQYPELEYSLGIVLYSKDDIEGATKHLQSYVNRSPNGPNAGAARNALAQMQTAIAATPEPSATTSRSPIAQPNSLGAPASGGPATGLLQDRNAPLLVKTPDYTCLESISRAQVDTRGHPHGAELIRIEVAVSDGREIYGNAGGKRFSNERLADMLGDTFSTTGLFNSIARALIAGSNARVVFAGEEALNGESVFRYNFQVLPGHAGWSIQYGKESGQAGEEGWFFVDSANLILRRAVVHAVEMPRNLKLKELDATIDYEPETIADRRVLLPYTAQVHVNEGSGMERASRMFFDHCRAFTAESALSFDVNSLPAQDNQAPGKADLPSDLEVIVSLVSPVSPASAAVNDVLTATVAAPVFLRGHEIIARGAIIEGHVRPLHGRNSVTIELDRVKTREGWAPFYAHIVSLAATAQAKAEGAGQESGERTTPADPEIPGVARIDFAGKSGELAAGTQMIWKTEPLAAPTEAHAPQLGTSMGMR